MGANRSAAQIASRKAARRASEARQFLNWHLVNFLQERGEKPAVAFTRSRPYRKNDNARVEQKNWTHARQLLGYDRLSDPESLNAINEVYRAWCTLKNFFVPVMNIMEKTRAGGKYRKRYDKPRTLADRILEWEGIGRREAAWIRKQKRELNPFALQEQVEAALKKVFATRLIDSEIEVRWEVPAPPARPSASLIDRSPTAPGLIAQPKAEQALTSS